MHRSSVEIYLDGKASESLVAFFDELPSSSTLLDHSIDPPQKRRKLSAGAAVDSSSSSLHGPPCVNDFLTLARVDINIISHENPRLSYPLPSLDVKSIDNERIHTACLPSRSSSSASHRKDEHHTVVLEQFFAPHSSGQYQIRVVTRAGEIIFDNVVRSNIPQGTLEVLQKAVASTRRKENFLIKTTITRLQENDHNRGTLGFCDEIKAQVFRLCVRFLATNARNISEGMGIARSKWVEFCAPELIDTTNAWSPRDFYDNVHVPKKEATQLSSIDEIECKLYPFQKRSVQWLLRREGVGKDDAVEPTGLPHGFVRTIDADGRPCFLSPLLGMITTHQNVLQDVGSNLLSLRGGILAEEMGLGKTVEMIALICAHKRTLIQDQLSPDRLPQSPATLIITPPAILQQWQNELQTVSPSLKVFIYKGLKVEAVTADNNGLMRRCLQNDVVLTTYNVLAKEIYHAETPERRLRNQKRYQKRLSPLTQIDWWRVVLDEAQMIESGVSNAAKVAKLIPREMAWCVSGTPVKRDARDLFGLLDFLRCEPYCTFSQHTWDSLVRHHKNVLVQIFQTLALRHTKNEIKEDLQLPSQTRVVVTVPFTQIEEQNYDSLFKDMCDDCGLDLEGAPLVEDWDPQSPGMIEKMGRWLSRLRQTCLHPEVGHRNRRALGNTKGPLRTVAEVLEVMIEQNDNAARLEERVILLSQIRRGQILEHLGSTEQSLQIWSQTLEEARAIVQACRQQLQAEIDLVGLTVEPGPHRQKLRAAIEIEHACTFFIANAYFQIKTDVTRTTPKSAAFNELEGKETLYYERARLLRKELLSEARKKTDTVTRKIGVKAKSNLFIKIPEVSAPKESGGIESRHYFERIHTLFATMEKQASQFQEWREHNVKLLLQPLVDEESGDVQGDEYENSTKEQDDVYVYVQILRALTADRHGMITGQDNYRIREEMRTAFKLACEGQGHSPELMRRLLATRDELNVLKGTSSMRGLLTEIRESQIRLRQSIEKGNSRAAAEYLIINGALKKLNDISTEQATAVMGLGREVEQFKDAMNLRLEYYKQLQAISDTVAPYGVEIASEARNAILSAKEADESRSRARLASIKGRGRYLLYLREQQTDIENQKLCIICQSSFEVGILTSCGHSYCVDCIRLWWNSHRTCPTCKKHLSRNDFHQITYKPQDLTIEEEAPTTVKGTNSAKDTGMCTFYSNIRDTTLNQVRNIDLDGSFGTKIDTLARQVLWIRQYDPGAKAIIFSQYKEFLEVLSRAFSQFKIGWVGFDSKNGIQKFKDEPSIECFLLHAKAHSSGLNLVNATHVLLCEPLINTAIELQAIARVHRIGQHQTTTVWMYLVENTVEKSIYNISVDRRLTHMDRTDPERIGSDEMSLESKIEAANTLELEQTPLAKLLTKGSTGGEMVDKADLWNCLFNCRFRQEKAQCGRVFEETERTTAQHLGTIAAEARV